MKKFLLPILTLSLFGLGCNQTKVSVPAQIAPTPVAAPTVTAPEVAPTKPAIKADNGGSTIKSSVRIIPSKTK